jgi:uncharacterized iron-regulated membrane protein
MTDIPAPEAVATAKPARSFSALKFLSWLHLWVGVIFSIPFIILGITGSVLMIDHLPTQFAEDPRAAEFKPVAEIIAAAQAVAPEGRVPVGYDIPNAPGEPAVVRFSAPPRGDGAPAAGPAAARNQARVTVDPVTLEAKAQQGGPGGPGGFSRTRPDGSINWGRVMHDLHGSMMIGGGNGRQIVGWLGVFMTGLCLTGIIMWWPKVGQWASAFKVRFGGSALRVNRETHGAAGIWGWLVFFVVCFSGTYIVFPQTFNTMLGASPAVRDARNQLPFNVTPVEGATPITADGAVQLAKNAVPGGIVRGLTLPANETQPYRVTLSRVGDFNGKPRSQVIIDPWANKVMETRDIDAYGSIDKFLAFQRQLHAGNGVGWWWFILVMISGLLPPLFVGTGITMYLLKRRNKKRVMAQ